jgi:hypothetical protein
MKKVLIVLALGIFMWSCGEQIPTLERVQKDGYDIVTIDGCEYIEVSHALGSSGGYYSLTHKGNCKNHQK